MIIVPIDNLRVGMMLASDVNTTSARELSLNVNPFRIISSPTASAMVSSAFGSSAGRLSRNASPRVSAHGVRLRRCIAARTC